MPGLRSGITFSKSVSPGQLNDPDERVVASGPSASEASPVVSKIPSVKGNDTPFPEK